MSAPTPKEIEQARATVVALADSFEESLLIGYSTHQTIGRDRIKMRHDALRTLLAALDAGWTHDCNHWKAEGIACAKCNPIAVELAKLDAQPIIHDPRITAGIIEPENGRYALKFFTETRKDAEAVLNQMRAQPEPTRLPPEEIETRHERNLVALHEQYKSLQWSWCPWCGISLSKEPTRWTVGEPFNWRGMSDE